MNQADWRPARATTRRKLIGSAAAVAAAAASPAGRALAGMQVPRAAKRSVEGMNVVIFMTDQERAIQHFPPGWAKQNLPGMTRLQDNGVTFNNAVTNACMCTPARATWMTRPLPAQHGCKWTLEPDMPADQYPQMELQKNFANIATVMSAAGYNVIYKGKFHLTKPARTRTARSSPTTSTSTASSAGTRRTPAPTRTSPRPAAARRTTTAAS